MKKVTTRFSSGTTTFYFAGGFSFLKKITDPKSAILITDENVFEAHAKKFKGWDTIVLEAGEEFKVQATADAIIDQLLEMGADRKTTLIGIGGGVITDITGFVASVYMRGIRFGFVPTSLLAMVDASIGGKNGVDVGIYKNMVGVTRQPEFILYDMVFLNTLPPSEWSNGFAEIIKHASIKDAAMFTYLEKNSLSKVQSSKKNICALVEKNARLKMKVVQKDEWEQGERKLLNFGHTLGHALENQYELSHGQAIAIGMTYASHFSEIFTRFKQTDRIVNLLEKYNLPTYAAFDKDKAIDALTKDKKRERNELNYVLLKKIGKGIIQPIPIKQVSEMIKAI